MAAVGRLERASVQTVLRNAAAAGGFGFADFLLYHKLGSLWRHRLCALGMNDEAPTDFTEALRARQFAETALYTMQRACLRELDELFAARKICYAVIKGAQLRELVYPEPPLRPASDIDILVGPDQREAAARALIDIGFVLHADLENISHEANLSRGPIDIDLHWDVLRPGRTRIAMAEPMLARRVRIGGFFCLHDTDAVFLMLVHPALSRYVCSPTVALCSAVDFVFWLKARPIDWDALVVRLRQAGLRTAAWTQLSWFEMLVHQEDLPVPLAFLDQLRPGAMREWYLRKWLRYDLPTRWLSKPLLVQIGLTLLLHDRPSDATHALKGWWRSRRARHADPLLRLAHERQLR